MTDTTNPTPSSLPADPDGQNADRAGWAAAAIAAFRRASGADPDDALTDLLADLMHWGDRSGHDFDRSLERARAHYEAETVGELTAATGSPSAFATPWSLGFDRDGTEDVAVLTDADGDPLVVSRPFWLPESDDPVPPTLAAVRLMATAPALLEALDRLLAQTVDQDLKHGIALTDGEADARERVLAAIAQAIP